MTAKKKSTKASPKKKKKINHPGPKKKDLKDRKITPEMFDAVLAEISTGISVVKACEAVGVNRNTFKAMAQESEELHTKYAHARVRCADSQFEKIEELEQELQDGEIDHQTYRALMDSMKWRLARMKPQSYGDAKKVDHVSSDKSMSPNKIEIVALEEEE